MDGDAKVVRVMCADLFVATAYETVCRECGGWRGHPFQSRRKFTGKGISHMCMAVLHKADMKDGLVYRNSLEKTIKNRRYSLVYAYISH